MQTSVKHSPVARGVLCNQMIEYSLYGKGFDWSIRNLKVHGDIPREPIVFENIVLAAMERRVCEIFAPDPSSSTTTICTESDMPGAICDVINHVSLRRGKKADGCILQPNQGFWIAVADSPVVVLIYPTRNPRPGKVVVAQAGKNCLLDYCHIMNRAPRRKYDSIIDAMCAQFDTAQIPKLQALIIDGIGASHYTHPWDHQKFGVQNERLTRHFTETLGPNSILGERKMGRLDLSEIILRQLVRHGVASQLIQRIRLDTFADTVGPHDRKFKWWSHRRGDQGRNGIFIVRRY